MDDSPAVNDPNGCDRLLDHGDAVGPSSLDPVPFRDHAGWPASPRLEANRQLSSLLRRQRSAASVAHSAAEYFRELFAARTVSVARHESGQYTELANVGFLPPQNRWYPPRRSYPDSVFRSATKDLQENGGYFTSDLQDQRYQEFVGCRHDPEVLSVMGAPIIGDGIMRGEVFLTRGRGQQAFDRNDLDFSRELASTLGRFLEVAH